MMGIIKDMYKAYIDSVEKGLRNRLQTFTFRNIDSIFLDPVELDNTEIFSQGLKIGLLIWFLIILGLMNFKNNSFLL